MKDYSTFVAVEAVAADFAWRQPEQDDLWDDSSETRACSKLGVGHIKKFLSELLTGARLLVTICVCLGSGWRWLGMCLRLIAFCVFLLPGFCKMIVYYYTSTHIQRGLRYGSKPRQTMDLYISHEVAHQTRRPVVIFITGGAWIIGYRAWGALLARRLCSKGVVVCCLDYRNFPTSAETVVDMIEDVNTGIHWVLSNTDHIHGDPYNIHVVGQSAGAHLSSLCLLLQSLRFSSPSNPTSNPTSNPRDLTATHDQHPHPQPHPHPHPRSHGPHPSRAALRLADSLTPWHPNQIRSFIGVSGPYNLAGLRQHFHQCGLHASLFDRIMSISGVPSLDVLSPRHLVSHLPPEAARQLPPLRLLHGTQDRSVPCQVSADFAQVLRKAGAKVDVVMYKDETHTTPLLENPMRGGADPLTDDILSTVFGGHVVGHYPSMNFDALLRIGTWFSPF